MNNFIRKLKAAVLWIDRAIETFAVSAVALMTMIVTLQVVTRKLFDFVFFWSEELTLLLLVWFSFLGIAIGFRDRHHLAMDALTNRLPARANRWLDKIIGASILAFGLYLIVYGWDYTMLVKNNTMSATGWSSSVKYIIMPITGLMICFYSLLQVCGIDTVQHQELEEEGSE
jgi:TRAP-type C4-dicarboxylate transport system permease small subunit